MALDPSHAATTCLCQEKRDPLVPPVIVSYRMEPTASANHEGQKLEVAADAARRVYQEGTVHERPSYRCNVSGLASANDQASNASARR
jgi:hypothetical protein